jgi:hypothetical protein
MRIYIQGIEADARLEGERTVGELASSIGAWLDGQGFKASRILADGAEAAPETPLQGLNRIDVEAYVEPASALRALAAGLKRAIVEQQGGGLAMNAPLLEWLKEAEPDLAASCERFSRDEAARLGDGTLSGEQAAERGAMLASLLEERAREREDGLGELGRTLRALKPLLSSLSDLSFMLQTGKDAEAYATLLAFAELAGKLVRCVRASLPSLEGLSIDGSDLAAFSKDLSGYLAELLGSLERKDLVGLGDVAEYEVVPRLLKLHEAFEASVAEAV